MTRERSSLPLALAASVYLAFVWRFDWLCDDAYITFRYARNLAEGAGLVYNPGERIEGYSNFLWTVWLALFERVGVDVTVAARVSSALCGLGVLGLLARLFERLELTRWQMVCALAFPATLPPLAVWATGGLAPMPLALLLLLAFERLVADPERAHGIQAGLAAGGAALVRADGPLGVALVLGPLIVVGLRDRRVLRAALTATAIAAAAFAAHLAWRYAYYGELAPNTARVKVDPNAITFERGAKYLGHFAATYPAVLIALAVGLAGTRRLPRGQASTWSLTAWSLTAWSTVLGFAAYSMFVGGDFMAMGRFLVPALPFAALLFALGCARLSERGPAAAAVPALVMSALSLLGAYDMHAVPRSWREACYFRWSADGYRTEHEQWQMMRGQALRWSLLGRALARHTRPGESLIHGTIGAVGYHSRLHIHDPFGLVNREEFKPQDGAPVRRSPGHHRRVLLATFMQYSPDYLDAALVPRSAPDSDWPRWLRPEAEFGDRASPVWAPLDGLADAPPDMLLRLIRNRQP